MSDRIIQAKAVISAEDRTGKAFDQIAKKFQQIGKGAKVSADVDRMMKSLSRAESGLKAIDKFESKRPAFATARTNFRAAQAEVERLAKAMAAADKPTKQLETDFKRAQAAVKAASAAYEKQSAAIKSARRAMEDTGVSFGKTVSEQGRLRAAVDRTTAAIERQLKAERAASQVRPMRAPAAAARHADEYGRHIRRHGVVGAAAGAAAGAVGVHSVVRAIEETARSGATYQHEVVALRNAGRTPEEVEEIQRASKATAQAIPTASYTENLKVINETTSAFGSLHHAIEHLPFMQKAASVVHAAAGDKITDDAGAMGNKMARFAEERGSAGNGEQFERETAKLVQAMVFTRGNFNPHEMLNFAQQAKSSLQGYNERFLTRIMPSIVGTSGGERAGTAANAFNSVIGGKVNDKKQAEAWLKYGLLDPKQVTMKAGHAVGWNSGAVKDTALAHADPLEWMEKVALPAMQKKGVNVHDRESLTNALATMFRNTNANFFATELGQEQMRARLHKDEAMQNQAGSMDEIYDRNLKTDPTVAMKALSTSLDNLMTVASSPAMETAAGFITGVAHALGAVADAAKDHPALALGGAAAAGAAGLAGSGYVTYQMLNGFGLGASATALDASAAALTEAAVALNGGKLLKSGALPLLEAAAPSLLSRIGGFAATAGGVAAPLIMLRELGEAHRPMTPEGAPYRLDQKIDPGTWERAQRGVMEQRMDPEGRRGREMMRAFGPSADLEGKALTAKVEQPIPIAATPLKVEFGAIESRVVVKVEGEGSVVNQSTTGTVARSAGTSMLLSGVVPGGT